MVDEPVPGIPLRAEAGPRPWDWRLALSAGTGLLSILLCLALIVPKFDEVYRQVKVAMPDSTEALLMLSRATCRYLWLAGIGVTLFTYDIGRWTGWQAKLARKLIPIVTIATGVWIVVALFLPLIGGLEGIGPKKH